MNRHGLIDVATITASAFFVRNNCFFSQSLESDAINEVVRNTVCSVGSLQQDALHVNTTAH